jgi:hypothetical protein
MHHVQKTRTREKEKFKKQALSMLPQWQTLNACPRGFKNSRWGVVTDVVLFRPLVLRDRMVPLSKHVDR